MGYFLCVFLIIKFELKSKATSGTIIINSRAIAPALHLSCGSFYRLPNVDKLPELQIEFHISPQKCLILSKKIN